MDEDDVKKELEDALPKEDQPEKDDPFAMDGLAHVPAPEDDGGGERE